MGVEEAGITRMTCATETKSIFCYLQTKAQWDHNCYITSNCLFFLSENTLLSQQFQERLFSLPPIVDIQPLFHQANRIFLVEDLFPHFL